jgi:hypothetical protein
LAEKLGMTVGEMLRTISNGELVEWMAYFSLQAEPEKKVNTAEVLKAMFAHRVRKKK